MPVARNVLADPRITENPIYAPAAKTLEFGTAPPTFVGSDGWERTVVLPEFQKILVGASTVEAAVDTMIVGLEKVLQ